MKNGDMVYASDESEEHAINRNDIYSFIGVDLMGRFCVQAPRNKAVHILKFAVPIPEPIPEPKLIPWTNETRPMVPFTVVNGDGNDFMITCANEYECRVALMKSPGTIDHQDLLDNFMYAPTQERDNLVPCGTES